MQPKRIILMHISQVSGHRSAAMAIESAIKELVPQTQIMSINAFNYTSPATEKFTNFLYMNVVSRFPKIWGYLYDNPKVVKGLENAKNFVHNFNSPKLKKLFEEFRPDVVACTQAYPCGMVADYKKIHKIHLPLVAVLTDFVPHSFWIYDDVDFYISPSDEVTNRLKDKGIPESKIRTFGIPFDNKFNFPVDTARVFAQYGLNPQKPTVLIMGGGHGLGPLNEIVRSLEKVSADIQEIVVTGVNTRLYKAVENEIKKCRKKIVLLGFVNNIHELMSISDLIITKPGGITTAEALTKQLPMVIVQPIPGQEANNSAYLTEKKAAVEVNDPKEINIVVEDLLAHPQKLELLRKSAAAIAKPHSSSDIAGLLLGV
ncbi:MAG: glycosyltransferase [Candidatus Omnitrophica bacterium]|nr:glycosyltransferase [Candidatus Omnitrophota bacterium]MDD5653923.1 glycosyltransferase [Candidatus Omnitrophota bacterium]